MPSSDNDDLANDFGEVIALLRQGPPQVPSERPRDEVWVAIATELGQPALALGMADPDPIRSNGGGDARSDDGVDFWAAPPSWDQGRPPWWGRPLALGAAIAVGLLLVVLLVLAVRGDASVGRRADVSALGEWPGDGTAVLNGRELTVSIDGGTDLLGEHYEVWLLDIDGGEVLGVRSLGPVEVGDDATFVLADNVDLDRFDVVDVSIEPDDGDPAHSGQSVLRGELVS